MQIHFRCAKLQLTNTHFLVRAIARRGHICQKVGIHPSLLILIRYMTPIESVSAWIDASLPTSQVQVELEMRASMSIARRSAHALMALVSQTETAGTPPIPSPKSRQIPKVKLCIITFAGTLSFDFYPICIRYVKKAEIISKQTHT